ncbi:hypothetical protein FPV67DRAFT_628628 [Lyophyllum atratum]|nr:hypothetical protein FPV67DRAFT_628628 [Lyophyllum atratum]
MLVWASIYNMESRLQALSLYSAFHCPSVNQALRYLLQYTVALNDTRSTSSSTMANFGIVEARIASFFAESVTLGLYLVTFFNAIFALFSTGLSCKTLRGLNYPMFIAVVLMFLNIILSSVATVVIMWRAFVTAPPGTAEKSFSDISYWAVELKAIFVYLQATVGDALLIYRCWVVYARSCRVIAFSAVLWMGGTACIIVVIYDMSRIHGEALVSANKFYPFIVSFWASTVTLNIVTTGLLLWPIWKVAREHDKFAPPISSRSGRHSNKMKQIMRVIIESGLMYTVTAFMTFVSYVLKCNSLYVIANVVRCSYFLDPMQTLKDPSTPTADSHDRDCLQPNYNPHSRPRSESGA